MRPFGANGKFQGIVGQHAVRRTAVRGAGATMLSSVAGVAIQIASISVLARILRPADFGLVAMVTTFSLLVSNFGLNGITEAILQTDEIGSDLASNLFWFSLAAGVTLTLAFAAAGGLLAKFYNDPLVKDVAVAQSLTILITSASVVHLALLKRAMRFSTTSVNDLLSRAASIGLSIYLACIGWGYWALIAGALAQPAIQAIGAAILCRWRPGRPRRVEGFGAILRFAFNVYGRFGVNYVSRNTDNLLVGWRFNALTLGYYKKAYDLFAFPASVLVASLSNIALSTLSRFRHDQRQYRRYLLNAVGTMAFVGMGIGAVLTLAGSDVIIFLLGPSWEPAGRIFTFFGPGIGFMLVYGTHGWIHLSLGRPERWLLWGLIEVGFTILLFLGALPWGPVGIAVAWTTSFSILTFPAFWYAGRPIRLGAGPVWSVVWRYIVASIIAAGLSAPVVRLVHSDVGAFGSLIRILCACALFGLLYLALVVLLHRGLGPIHMLANLTREMLTSGAPAKSLEAVGGVEPAAPALEASLSNIVGIHTDTRIQCAGLDWRHAAISHGSDLGAQEDSRRLTAGRKTGAGNTPPAFTEGESADVDAF